MSIVWYLTETTESALVITFATLCGYLPQALLGLFTGTIVDKYNRKNIVMISDFSTAMAALIFAFSSYFFKIPLAAIFILLAIRSVGSAFQSPALNAITPTIVPKEELPRCSGIMQSFESISLLLSPAFAAIFFSVWDIGTIAYLDVFGAAIAILILFFLKIPNTSSATVEENKNAFKNMKDAFKIIVKQPGLLSVLIISSLYAFIYFPIGSMYPLMTLNYFQGSIQDSSVVEIVFSAGSLIGSFILGFIGNKLNQEKTISLSIGIYGIGLLCSGLLSPSALFIFILLSALMGFTLPFFYGMQNTIFQSRVPNEYLGRVLSLLYSISLFATPIGLLLGGGLSEAMGVQNAFFIGGICSVLLGISMFISTKFAKTKSSIDQD